LRFSHSSNRVVCRPEGNEERIAFAVDLAAAVPVEGGTEKLPVLVEQVRVGIASALEQHRRPLNIGEEKSDGALRSLSHLPQLSLATGQTGSALGVPRRILELSVPRACRQAPNGRSTFPVRQRCKLQQACVQALELAFRHRVEVDTTNALLGARALQPPKEDLGGTGIGNCALAQTTLDLGVARDRAVSARAKSCGCHEPNILLGRGSLLLARRGTAFRHLSPT
jgi:hypothetical protein